MLSNKIIINTFLFLIETQNLVINIRVTCKHLDNHYRTLFHYEQTRRPKLVQITTSSTVCLHLWS